MAGRGGSAGRFRGARRPFDPNTARITVDGSGNVTIKEGERKSWSMPSGGLAKVLTSYAAAIGSNYAGQFDPLQMKDLTVRLNEACKASERGFRPQAGRAFLSYALKLQKTIAAHKADESTLSQEAKFLLRLVPKLNEAAIDAVKEAVDLTDNYNAPFECRLDKFFKAPLTRIRKMSIVQPMIKRNDKHEIVEVVLENADVEVPVLEAGIDSADVPFYVAMVLRWGGARLTATVAAEVTWENHKLSYTTGAGMTPRGCMAMISKFDDSKTYIVKTDFAVFTDGDTAVHPAIAGRDDWANSAAALHLGSAIEAIRKPGEKRVRIYMPKDATAFIAGARRKAKTFHEVVALAYAAQLSAPGDETSRAFWGVMVAQKVRF